MASSCGSEDVSMAALLFSEALGRVVVGGGTILWANIVLSSLPWSLATSPAACSWFTGGVGCGGAENNPVQGHHRVGLDRCRHDMC